MILERYIARSFLAPFLFSMSVITFLFVMDFILRYIDLFLDKGVQLIVVMQTFILSLGHMFALIIPMAVLPTTLMAFGNLASENEITAMRASGVSLYRMILPGVALGALLTIGMILYNNHVLPESNHKLLNLLIDINKKKPTIEIKENVFIDAFAGYTIYVRHKNDKTGEIREVQIFKKNPGEALPTTIVAEKGFLEYLEPEHVLRFELENGEIHEMPEGNELATYRRTVFKNYVINIKDIDRSLQRSERNYRGDREMSVKQMQEKIESFRSDIADVEQKMAEMATRQVRSQIMLLEKTVRDSVLAPPETKKGPSQNRDVENVRQIGTANVASTKPPVGSDRQPKPPAILSVTRKALESQAEIRDSYLRQINRYRVEIHKKFSIPFACIVFVLVGSPIAIRLGKTGMNMAIGMSILVFLVYYICLIGGEKLADRGIMSPVFSMWIPNVLFGIAAAFLIKRTTQEQSVIRLSKLNPLRLIHRSS